MPDLSIRKTAYSVEEIFHEGGPIPAKSLRRAAGVAVITNPFAGRYEPDIQSVSYTHLTLPTKA